MAERWVDRVNDIDGVGTYVSYKLDKQLFRRSVRGACKMVFFKGDFADDVALLATTRELTINTYNDVCSPFAARITIEKTKFMVVGYNIVFEASLDTVNTNWKGPLPALGGDEAESVGSIAHAWYHNCLVLVLSALLGSQ